MCRWHGNDESKEVVNEGIECFVHERSPRQSFDRLQSVVYEQLRKHKQESKGVHSIHQTVYEPRVPIHKMYTLLSVIHNIRHVPPKCVLTSSCAAYTIKNIQPQRCRVDTGHMICTAYIPHRTRSSLFRTSMPPLSIFFGRL